MPYSEPVKPGDTMDTVRKIGRLAQLVLELKTEYERRPRHDTLNQIKSRAAELFSLAEELDYEPPASDQNSK